MRASLFRSLIAFACLVVWAQPSQAAIACTAETNFAFSTTGTGGITSTVIFPTSTPAGGFKYVWVMNRSDTTTTISSVRGAVDGILVDWTLDQGPVNMQGGGARAWTYYWPNATAGTETVVVTFSGSITSQIIGGWCIDAATTSPKDAEATPTNFTAQPEWDTNDVTATAAGAIFGACYTGTNSITWTPNDGSTQLESGGGGQRMFPFFRVVAAGAQRFDLTPSTTITGTCLVSAFKEPAAGGTCTGGLTLLGAGKCDH